MEKSDIEVTGLIYDGIMIELNNWAILDSALKQKAKNELPPHTVNPEDLVLTGTDEKIKDKFAFFLIDTMSNYEVNKEDIRDDIKGIMKSNFGSIIEDNSDLQVI